MTLATLTAQGTARRTRQSHPGTDPLTGELPARHLTPVVSQQPPTRAASSFRENHTHMGSIALTIDISTELRALCDKLGLDYNDTAEITIAPGKAAVVTYLRNDAGMKYIVDHEPATESTFIEVTT